jgi:hypothetical protein
MASASFVSKDDLISNDPQQTHTESREERQE